MSAISAIIFDIGNVLITWDPKNLYKKLIADKQELDWFCSEVVTLDWHTHHDAGLSMQEGIKNLITQYPDYADEIAAFDTRWAETIGDPVEGMLDLMQQLSAKNIPMFAITNYSAEKYPEFEQDFPFADHFTDVIVSGREGIVKPSPEIYKLAIERFGIIPHKTLFIDDRAENIHSAAKFGIQGHVFSSSDILAKELKTLKLL
jgi:2-haloacid dehalogenase